MTTINLNDPPAAHVEAIAAPALETRDAQWERRQLAREQAADREPRRDYDYHNRDDDE